MLGFVFVAAAATAATWAASEAADAAPLVPFFRSDYKYQSRQGAFYKIQKTPLRFRDAHARCVGEGAELAFPRTEAEAQLFATLMGENLRSYWEDMWLGASDILAEGVFLTTATGEDIDDLFVNWTDGEPTDSGYNEDCVTIGRNTEMNDLDCAATRPSICRRSDQNLTFNQKCDTYDPAYVLDGEGGHCYKVHTEHRNWSQAFTTCYAEQSYLLILNSEKERQFIVNLLKVDYAPEKLTSNLDKYQFAAGFNDLLVEGDFRTIQGQTLAEAGFEDWAWLPGFGFQPDNRANVENCGNIFRDGTLNDVDCAASLMFICERELPNHIDVHSRFSDDKTAVA